MRLSDPSRNFLKARRIFVRLSAAALSILLASGAPVAPLRASEVADPDQLFSLASSSLVSGEYESAISECKNFLALYSRHPKAERAHYIIAEALFQQGRYPEAASKFRDFTGLFGGANDNNLEISARQRLGECYFNLRKFLNAIDEFEWVAKSANKSLRAEALVGTAYAYMAREEYVKAEQTFVELLGSYPAYQTLPSVTIPMGLILMKRNEYKQALDFFGRSPDDLASLYYRGVCQRLMNRVIASATLFKEVLDNDFDKKWSDKALTQMGESYFQSKEFPLAYDSFKKAYNNYSASSLRPFDLFRMGCVSFTKNDFEQAGVHWSTLVRDYPQNFSGSASQYLLAEIALRQGEYGKAIEGFSKLLGLPEYNMDAQYKIIWCLGVQGQYDAAIGKADRFIKDYEWGELHAKVTLIKGLCQQMMKRQDEAILTYQSLIDRYPDTIYQEKALYLITICMTELKRYAEIVTQVYQALKMAPASPSPFQAETYYWVAEAYYSIGQYDLARQVYEMVTKNYRTSPFAPNAFLGIAACYARVGEYDKAIDMQVKATEFSQEMQKPEVKISALLDSADVLFNQRQYDKAVSYYDEFARKYPEDPRAEKALYQQGLALYRTEYFKEAIKRWDQLVSRYPQGQHAPDALFQSGRTYFGLGEYENALITFRRLMDSYPQSPLAKEALLQVGQSYYNQGNYEQSIVQYRAYLERYPQDERIGEVTDLLQMSYYKQGKTAKELKDLMSQFPKSKFTAGIFWELGAEAYNQKDYQKALDYFQRIILDFPDSSQAHQAYYYKADSYFLMGEYPAAITNFKNFIVNYPNEPLVADAGFKLGVAYFSMKDYLQASVAFNDFIEAHPNDPKARDAALNIPVCYRKAGQPFQAIDTYNNFLRRFPKDEKLAFVQMQIGQLYEDAEDWLKALDAYAKVPADQPEIFETLFSMGRCHHKLKDFGQEMKVYERLYNFSPKDNQFRLAGLVQLGEMYEERGMKDNAIKIYQDIQSYSTNTDWRQIAKEKIASLSGGK